MGNEQLKAEITLTVDQVDEWCFINGYRLERLSRQLPKEEILAGGIEGILNNVSLYTGISVDEIVTKSRKPDIVIPRQLAHAAAKLRTRYSLSYIGKEIGCKDHSTVLHSAKTISNWIDTDKEFCEKYSEIIEMYGLK